MDDIHTDSKHSTDIRQAIDDICFILDILYKKPSQRISYRWLSSYDCSVTLIMEITTKGITAAKNYLINVMSHLFH